MDFPDLKMIIAHLGHPWETDTVVLIRKCPNVYTDLSAVHYRPWRYWQAMITAMEYGVEHKILPEDPFVAIDPSNQDALQFVGVNNRFNQITVDGIRQNDDFGLNNNGYP